MKTCHKQWKFGKDENDTRTGSCRHRPFEELQTTVVLQYRFLDDHQVVPRMLKIVQIQAQVLSKRMI